MAIFPCLEWLTMISVIYFSSCCIYLSIIIAQLGLTMMMCKTGYIEAGEGHSAVVQLCTSGSNRGGVVQQRITERGPSH